MLLSVVELVGLVAFAASGALVGVSKRLDIFGVCLIGATTAIGGGVLRDVLVNEMPLLLHRDLYAVPALIGSTVVVASSEFGLTPNVGLVVGTVSASTIRLLALWRHWNLPGPRISES